LEPNNQNSPLETKNSSHPLTDFTLAWGLLTSIPLPFAPTEPSPSPGRTSAYFPLVGLILGGVLAGTGWLFYWLLPGNVAAALLLALWVGLTGLLHLDGFMDSCDGLLPPRDRERRLEIMKDSRVGAFGVVGGVLLLLLKFNALLALPLGHRWSALVTVPVLARWAMTWVMARYPQARSGGLGVLFSTGLGRRQVGLASVVAVAVSFSLMGWIEALILLAATWVTATLMARLAMARIHGLSGDVYGATCELVEAVLLLVVVAAGSLEML
jgi:adenosylcobinamide-GDP ribazoletransferase